MEKRMQCQRLIALSWIAVSLWLGSNWSVQAFCPRATFAPRLNTVRQYSNVADPPLDSSFQEKLQHIATSNPSSSQSRVPSHVIEVDNLEDYKTTVVEETEQLTVVRFYAPWCKACKAIEPHFYKLHKSFPAKYVQVPVKKDNVVLHQGLGVQTLPYGHIYHPEAGLVEELKISKAHFGNFKAILQSYVDGQCPLPDEVDPYTRVYASPYARVS